MGCKPSKLGNFSWRVGGGGGSDWILLEKSVLAPVELIQNAPSVLSSDRERSEMASYISKVADKTRLDITLLRDFKINFNVKFYFVAYLSFHIFHVSITSCITPQKTIAKTGKNIFWDGKKNS